MSKSSNMVYKTLVVGIIVLLIGMSVVSSNGNMIKRNHYYYGNQPYKSGSGDNNDTTPPVTNISLRGNVSEFGIFTDDVEVTLNATDDLSGVNVTYYELDIGGHKIYTEPFIVPGHMEHLLVYWSVDNAGNKEEYKSVYIPIDLIPPEIHLYYRILKNNSIEFDAYTSDSGSGDYKVEYYIDNEYMCTKYWNESYKWIWTPPGPGYYIASGIVYDRAEYTGQDEIPVNIPRSKFVTYSLFQLLFERFPNMEVFLRIMNLLR